MVIQATCLCLIVSCPYMVIQITCLCLIVSCPYMVIQVTCLCLIVCCPYMVIQASCLCLIVCFLYMVIPSTCISLTVCCPCMVIQAPCVCLIVFSPYMVRQATYLCLSFVHTNIRLWPSVISLNATFARLVSVTNLYDWWILVRSWERCTFETSTSCPCPTHCLTVNVTPFEGSTTLCCLTGYSKYL